MAKQSKLVDPTGEYVGEMKSDVGGRKAFIGKSVPVGDPEEIDRIIEEEFNPVKSKGSEIKKTASFDNARLEYMRMQIGPVQNFYTTLGNILLSFDERLRILEERNKQSENTKHE